MLGINTGFKRNKPRQFSYIPRYYDKEQEERDIRNTAREGRNNSEKYVPGSLVKGMRMERYKPTSSHNDKRQAMEARNRTVIRLSIFLFLLVLIGYIVMNSTLLEKIFSTFVN